MPPSPTSSRIAPTVNPLIQSSLKIAAIIMRCALRGMGALLLPVLLAAAVLHWVIVP